VLGTLRKLIVALGCIALLVGAVALPIAAEGEDSGGNAAASQYGEDDGCTPGYWKNHTDSWADSGYSPSDSFDAVFGTDYFDPDITLLEALNLKGGDINALARHAVAALLNAGDSNVDYALTANEIEDLVRGADGDPETVKDEFDAFNNAGCPINAFGEVTG